ncbi:MAG: CehA/McbA family metallohydrolase [Acidobacteriota bacterium]|jgi:hypothetical protein|nr:CehA/McbA family metallohydrolase [Bryobacteraceae bacterium CoA2 C42]
MANSIGLWRLAALVVVSGLLVVAQRQLSLAGRLELGTAPQMPVKVYLFKDDKPFRLNPVQAILPIKVDLFYRDRLWQAAAEPKTLEVLAYDQSHYFLLTGAASFELPPGRYRVEASRGLFYRPVSSSFELRAGETTKVDLRMERWAAGDWLAGDDHIHLPRGPEENGVFLRWMEAEDLAVGNFLQLQRQMDAAPQYAFGEAGEARSRGYAIRSGQESRSEPFGHIELLGGRELVRPVSVGSMYANEPGAYPFPGVWFQRGRAVGALTGFAHFHGSMAHSTLPMDLALGHLDFLEVFQFGKLWTAEWYELLNAGFRVTGVAGSDFPVPLGRALPWPRYMPLLGPERTLVKGAAGDSAWRVWAAGVKQGEVVVSNGPLVEVRMVGGRVKAVGTFFRPLERLAIVRNGKVIAEVRGDGRRERLEVEAPEEGGESAWYAAHAVGQRGEGEPEMQAHTNPVFRLREGRPVRAGGAREALAARWEAELGYYRGAQLPFAKEEERREFFAAGERALGILRQ